MQLSLEVSCDYSGTPLSSRDGAPPLRRHHSTPSWSVQTPTQYYYYSSAADMYREFSNCTSNSYPITPVSDEEYRSQYVIDSSPQSTGSLSPQSFGTVTLEMLRSIPRTLPPSPLSTADMLGGLTHSCAYPGCTFVSADMGSIRRHAMTYHMIDDNGLLPTTAPHPTPCMSPLTPPSRGHTPHSRSTCRPFRPSTSNLPLILSAADKSHVCEICDRRFKRLEHLRRHNKSHTGERVFRCEVTGCGKWFGRSDNLMAHRRYRNLLIVCLT